MKSCTLPSQNLLSRRELLSKTLGVAGCLTLAKGTAANAVTTAKPTLHVYPDYGWLRGFSVVPSWGARIEEAWELYDGARMREELVPAKALHANCIRLWIEFTAWMIDPEKVTANFLDAVAAIDEAGMKVMPCLFNRWHDSKFDYGGTYLENILKGWKPHLEYVKALVTPLVNDDRVLIWDLCNEPQSGASWAKEMTPEAVKKEHEWLAAIAQTVRELGAKQPITIGTMSGENIEAFADICDVLCGHPYAHDKAGLEQLIKDNKDLQQKYGKPFLVNECMPGADSDKDRGDIAAIYHELLSKAGFGWMGWALREGKAISTRRDRIDANGLNGYGFHPFALKNGQLRGGMEALTATPKLSPPGVKSK